MYNLRKKTSPFKYKHESMRFVGDGQCFKAKLIGILEVSEARGDRMCQEALADLKMAIRAAGEHKQRITIHIALDGLRLRDEKNGDCLYHHPVHKISFIAQDMTDSRAFGYIFGSPDSGHRFFGIKTDKAASQVVIAMRDLFQVVFALKKKEIELAKQHLETNYKHHSSSVCSNETPSSTSEVLHYTNLMDQALKNFNEGVQESKKEPVKKEHKEDETNRTQSETVVANLVDLQLELNNLQQGINQMKKITPSDPFGSKEDPFGDSFTGFPNPILPPPPSSGKDRTTRVSDSGSLLSPRNPLTSITSDTASCDSVFGSLEKSDGEVNYRDGKKDVSTEEWYSSFNTVFSNPKPPEDDKYEDAKKKILQQFDIFTELDPLGTGTIKPYVDKKYFFQELKEPPKKPLNELVSQSKSISSTDIKLSDTTKAPGGLKRTSLTGSSDPFGEDPFDSLDPFAEPNFQKDPFEDEFMDYRKSKSSIGSEITFNSMSSALPNMGKKEYVFEKPQEDKFTSNFHIAPPPLPPKKQNDSFQVKFPDICHNSGPDIYSIPKNIKLKEYYFDFKPEVDKTPGLIKIEDKLVNTLSTGSSEPIKHSIESAKVWPSNHSNISTSIEDKNDMKNMLDELDINLSELRLADLNKLAESLNIPSYLLGKMSIVELTEYLSNVIKSHKSIKMETNPVPNEPEFKADFEKGLSDLNKDDSIDRYAVFRELIDKEIKQIPTAVETTPTEQQPIEISKRSNETLNQSVTSSVESHDKYAALRDIVESELKESSTGQFQDKDSDEFLSSRDDIPEVVEQSCLENNKTQDDEILPPPKLENIDLETNFTHKKVEKSEPNEIATTKIGSETASDLASESSPENDNAPYNEEKVAIVTEEKSWTAFEQVNDQTESNNRKDNTQSEDAHSPWSSDSKEFINQSPNEWKKGDAKSGGDQWMSLPPNRRYKDNWWPSSNEREMYHMHPRHAYSYDNEYDTYNRQRRRRRDNWTKHCDEYETGEHSSSSRETSPWEEKPKRELSRESRVEWPRKSFDRVRDKRYRDEWFEDEYDYQENFKGPHRNGSYRNREHETELRRHWPEDMPDRSFRKKRENIPERWYSSDWKDDNPDKSPVRYSTMPWRGHAHSPKWKERDYNDMYFSRSPGQDSWEEEYPSDVENVHVTHSSTFGRKWKRPSSASEMERKVDGNPRHYFTTGNSDGERDKRYRTTRRSKSRDSRYAEPKNLPKFDPFSLSSSGPKNSQNPRYKPEKQMSVPTGWTKPDGFDQEFNKLPPSSSQKKKECCKTVERRDYGSIKRNRAQGKISERLSPNESTEKSVSNKPDIQKPKLPLYENLKSEKPESNNMAFEKSFEKSSLREAFRYSKNNSLFEDDFSPDKLNDIPETKAMSTVKEEDLSEAKDSFETDDIRQKFYNRKQSFYKAKGSKLELKKSESVNIFSRENDPFDDDFFAEDEFFDNSK